MEDSSSEQDIDPEAVHFLKLLATLKNQKEADLVLIFGGISREKFIKLELNTRSPQAKNLMLFIETFGGDPHAAYRMARLCNQRYDNVSVYVLGFCKSAGTLLAMGGQELVISDVGELGPLDMQLPKRNEVVRRGSSLELPHAFDFLGREVQELFRQQFSDVAVGLGGAISSKMAADIAQEVCVGLLSNVYAQIDPMLVGTMERALQIGMEYGLRLQDINLKGSDSLRSLVSKYPDHGFVIDRTEAACLFKKVRAPSPDELEVGELLLKYFGQMDDVIDFKWEKKDADDELTDGNDSKRSTATTGAGENGAEKTPKRVNETAKTKPQPRRRKSTKSSPKTVKGTDVPKTNNAEPGTVKTA